LPALLAGAWLACGIKSPPRPPLHILPDAGPTRAYYAPQPLAEEDGGLMIVLHWINTGAPAAGRLTIEEHILHTGDDGPKCGRRRIVGLTVAKPEVSFRVERPQSSATYQLLDASGMPISGSIDVGR
jgi:hypothetical protein